MQECRAVCTYGAFSWRTCEPSEQLSWRYIVANSAALLAVRVVKWKIIEDTDNIPAYCHGLFCYIAHFYYSIDTFRKYAIPRKSRKEVERQLFGKLNCTAFTILHTEHRYVKQKDN